MLTYTVEVAVLTTKRFVSAKSNGIPPYTVLTPWMGALCVYVCHVSDACYKCVCTQSAA